MRITGTTTMTENMRSREKEFETEANEIQHLNFANLQTTAELDAFIGPAARRHQLVDSTQNGNKRRGKLYFHVWVWSGRLARLGFFGWPWTASLVCHKKHSKAGLKCAGQRHSQGRGRIRRWEVAMKPAHWSRHFFLSLLICANADAQTTTGQQIQKQVQSVGEPKCVACL